MKKVGLSWSDWYAEQIKKGSKSIKEELEKCKEQLRLCWEHIIPRLLDTKPWFMEQLLEDMPNIDESQAEEALDDLINNLFFIFPLHDCIELYINWKDRVDFKRVDNAFGAMASLLAIDLSPSELEKLGDIFDRREAGELSDEQVKLELKKLGGSKKIRLCKMGLRALPYYLMYSIRMLEGVVSLTLLGNATARIHLRSTIEVFLRGAMFEHILRYDFREDVNQMLRLGKRLDTVTLFVKEAEKLAKNLEVALETIINDPKLLSVIYDKMATSRFQKNLSVYDILYWLERWKVFYPISNSEKVIQGWYKELSQEVHGNLDKLVLNIAVRRCFLDEFLATSITDVIDIMIVATLNTVNNVLSKAEARLDYLNEEAFFEDLKNAGLNYSKKRFTDLTT